MSAPVPIVLVHGAWAGAWAWGPVIPALRAAGHAVHAVTLTGCGERAHLLSPAIDLHTHIADVLGLLRAEELDGVALVGHSYGGLPITGAADALLAEGPRRVRALVYVDAMLPLPGECWSARHDEATKAARRAAAAAQGCNALPPPDPAGFGLQGAARDWLQRRQVPHPFGAYDQPLPYSAQRLAAVPRHYLACTAPAYPTVQPMHARARTLPGMAVQEMACGHYPQIEQPEAFAAWLLAALRST